ncbi:MAG TPA: hypothetical protein VGI86_02040 [Acidimicrobiia bacterium]
MSGITAPKSVFKLALLATCAPLLATLFQIARDHYHPARDLAVIEITVRNVGTRATPLVGAWSRFGWSHPGPLPFYVFALPYRMLGNAPAGLELGALVVNAAAIVATLVIVRPRGRLVVLVAAAGLLAMQLGLAANVLRNPWNVDVPLFPFVLLLVAAADSTQGRRLSLVIAPLAATFVVQAHAGYIALAAPAIACWVVAIVLSRHDARTMRATAWATLAALVLWLPVIADAVVHRGGNLRRIVHWSLSSEPGAGYSTAAHLLGDAGSLRFPFLDGLTSNGFLEISRTKMGLAPGVLFVAMLVALGLVWRRSSALRVALVLLFATWLVALPASARIGGTLYPHLFFWSLPLGMLSWACIVLAVGVRWHQVVSASVLSTVTVVALIGVIALAATTAHRVVTTGPPDADVKSVIATFSRATLRELHGRKTVVIDRTDDYIDLGRAQAGMMAHLQHYGVTALVPRLASRSYADNVIDNLTIYTSRRVAARTSGKLILLIAGRESRLRAPGVLIAESDPLTPVEQRRWLADYRQVSDALVATGHRDLVSVLSTSGAYIAAYRSGSTLTALTPELNELMALNRRGEPEVLWAVRPLSQ